MKKYTRFHFLIILSKKIWAVPYVSYLPYLRTKSEVFISEKERSYQLQFPSAIGKTAFLYQLIDFLF